MKQLLKLDLRTVASWHERRAGRMPVGICAGVVIVLLLAACGSKDQGRPPAYEANPAPTEAYEVRVTLGDAPAGVFVSAATADYRIANDSCLPPIDNFEGVRYGIEWHSVPIQLERVDANTFVGTYFRDGLKVADYFGLGDCRWRLHRVDVNLRTEGTKSFTYFSISASPQEGSQTRFLEKDIKPMSGDGRLYPANDLSRERFEKEIPIGERNRFFSYSISINTRKFDQ